MNIKHRFWSKVACEWHLMNWSERYCLVGVTLALLLIMLVWWSL